MSLTVGSLFAGIGGIELGLERAGMEVVWQVEKDEWCRSVLAKHWPAAGHHGDIRHVATSELSPADIVAGGFPCQDIATVNIHRSGLDGERSGLWSEMWRTIRGIRPRYAVVENVAAIRTDGLGRVLGDLAESGYDAEWNSLPAGAFGAPHRRDRVFVVAYPRRLADVQTITSPGPVRALREARHYDSGGTWRGEPRTRRKLRPSEVVGVDDGLPRWMDRASRALGNAVVPQVAEWIGRRIVEHGERFEASEDGGE